MAKKKKAAAKKMAAAPKKKAPAKKAPAKKAPAKKAPAKKAPAKKAPAKKAPARKAAAPKKKAAAKKAAPKKAVASKKKSSEAEEETSSLPASVAPRAGTRAPNFVLTSDDGKEVSLSSLKGKKVVLYFYPKDDTPGCTTEACGFRDLHREFEKRGAVVLGVSKDSVKKHENFKKKYELPFALLSDENAEVISAYGSWGQKKFMGRTFDGILRTTVLIDPEGKITKIYPKVSVNEHAAEVLKDLEAM